MLEFGEEFGGFKKADHLSDDELDLRVAELTDGLQSIDNIVRLEYIQSRLLDLWNVHRSSDRVISAINDVKTRIAAVQHEESLDRMASVLPSPETKYTLDPPITSQDELDDINRKFEEIIKRF